MAQIKYLISDLIHPILVSIMKSQRKSRKQELIILNGSPGSKDSCAIYVVNHSCRHDFPITSEVIGHRISVLVGKQRLDFIDRVCFWLNGVIWVDRKSAEHKRKAAQRILSVLHDGESICMYPEGTWNLEPSKPLLPMYWGCIEIAKQAAIPIIPLVLEFKENDVYAKFGEPVYVMPSDKKADKFEELKEKMATLKWEIWEQFPAVPREKIDMDEWEREKEARIAAYPKLDYEYEKSCARKA